MDVLYKAPPPKKKITMRYALREAKAKTLQEGLFARSSRIVYIGKGEETKRRGEDLR